MTRVFDNPAYESLLPYGGAAKYFGPVLSQLQAGKFFNCLLLETEWKPDEAIVRGTRINTKRLAAWYGDADYSYSYSGVTKQALPWTQQLLELRRLAEKATGSKYNSCLLNLYHDGTVGVGWHSDNEDTLVKNASIASISLGAKREFRFMHRKTKERVSVWLENGSLLEMKGETQANWLHSLPKTAGVAEPRVSLTFRSFAA